MRFNELMTGGRQDVCKIFGDNLDSLARYATLLGEEVRQVPGAVDLYVEAVTGLPQLVVRYRREALLSYGLRVDEGTRPCRPHLRVPRPDVVRG